MTAGDSARFRVGGREYHLTLTRLQNFLIGDDFAVFEVSTQGPSAERVAAIRKAAQPLVQAPQPPLTDQEEHP